MDKLNALDRSITYCNETAKNIYICISVIPSCSILLYKLFKPKICILEVISLSFSLTMPKKINLQVYQLWLQDCKKAFYNSLNLSFSSRKLGNTKLILSLSFKSRKQRISKQNRTCAALDPFNNVYIRVMMPFGIRET